MLESTDFAGPTWQVVTTHCDHEPTSGVEFVDCSQIALARSGVFTRTADGVEHTVVPGVVHFFTAGEESHIAHPGGGHDSATALTPSATLLEELTPATGRFPNRTVPLEAEALVLHARLIGALGRHRRAGLGGDPFLVEEIATDLAAAVLPTGPASTTSGRCRQRRLAERALQVLAADGAGGWTLADLAERLGSNPFALSRAVSAFSGRNLTAWWGLMRRWRALQLMAADGATLAGVAVAAGYADQAHMTRDLRAATDRTPATLRKIIQDA